MLIRVIEESSNSVFAFSCFSGGNREGLYSKCGTDFQHLSSVFFEDASSFLTEHSLASSNADAAPRGKGGGTVKG